MNMKYKNILLTTSQSYLYTIPSTYSPTGTKSKMTQTKQTPKNPHIS